MIKHNHNHGQSYDDYYFALLFVHIKVKHQHQYQIYLKKNWGSSPLQLNLKHMQSVIKLNQCKLWTCFFAQYIAVLQHFSSILSHSVFLLLCSLRHLSSQLFIWKTFKLNFLVGYHPISLLFRSYFEMGKKKMCLLIFHTLPESPSVRMS